MSYLVLARKYRPKNFTEMVGQEHVVQALTNALTQQRLHHAYLFTGTRGVGKTTVSRILAKSLNCQGPDGQGGITAAPCGVCQACKDIDSGRFVDYTELDAASNRGVDEVQALLEQAVYKPVQGRFKVFMIDEVHMLTGHAFNAMLKTLEEPPEYLKFVLATTDPQKVPVTVLSRCLQFNLRPMAPETVQEHLAGVLQTEGVPADAQALRLIARSARGSMRDALSLTDQAIAFGSGKLEEATVRQMLGSVDRTYVVRLIEALARSDGRTVVETSEALRLHGLSAASTLEEMTSILQRMAVLQAVPQSVDESDAESVETARLAQLLPPDETQLLYSMCLHGRGELGLAPDEYAALTMVLLRLLAFKPGAVQAALAEKKTLSDGGGAAPRPLAVALHGNQDTAAVAAAPRFVAAPAASTGPASTLAVAPAFAAPAPPAPAHAATTPTATTPTATATAHAVVAAAPATAALRAPSPPQSAVPVREAPQPATRPPGQMLPVIDPFASANRLAANPSSQQEDHGQSGVVAIQVRQQPEPSARTEPRHESGSTGRPADTLVLTEEGNFWHQTVQQLVAAEAVTAMVRELALQSQLVARDVDVWMLRVERESLNQPVSRERLQNALHAVGHTVTLTVEVGRIADSPAARNLAAAQARQRAAEEAITNDPWVQDLMRTHQAKMLPVATRS
ncbi:MAG: DNA polymerase III subunit gamma/tau [Bdellovibrionales bacterium]|nr:DNA polymerase III subunit gamma/tau [Ramlibacter sp.]